MLFHKSGEIDRLSSWIILSNDPLHAYSVIIVGKDSFLKSKGLYPINLRTEGWFNFATIFISRVRFRIIELEVESNGFKEILAVYTLNRKFLKLLKKAPSSNFLKKV